MFEPNLHSPSRFPSLASHRSPVYPSIPCCYPGHTPTNLESSKCALTNVSPSLNFPTRNISNRRAEETRLLRTNLSKPDIHSTILQLRDLVPRNLGTIWIHSQYSPGQPSSSFRSTFQRSPRRSHPSTFRTSRVFTNMVQVDQLQWVQSSTR